MFSKDLLQELGVIDWGYTEELVPRSFDRYKKWSLSDHAGSLHYLQDHRRDLRSHLKFIKDDVQSALVFLFDYHGARQELEEIYQDEDHNGLKIASYAVGFGDTDYHRELAQRLDQLGGEVAKNHQLTYKISLDIQPVLERDLAHRAGLGWFGKNSMLISKDHGSFFLIGSLLLSQKLHVNPKEVSTDHCGQCSACIDACPTKAIEPETRTLIANQCISTYTIEMFKDDSSQIPGGFDEAEGEFFGCDICQDVCPWNERKTRLGLVEKSIQLKESRLVRFFLLSSLKDLFKELAEWSNNKFRKEFSDTSLGRTGRVGVMKNIRFWLNIRSKK